MTRGRKRYQKGKQDKLDTVGILSFFGVDHSPRQKPPDCGPAGAIRFRRRNLRLDSPQREILGLLLLALGVLTFLSLLKITQGTVSGWWAGFLCRIFKECHHGDETRSFYVRLVWRGAAGP